MIIFLQYNSITYVSIKKLKASQVKMISEVDAEMLFCYKNLQKQVKVGPGTN
jgi:hypothetical protein